MIDTPAPQRDERQGDGRPARQRLGREAEVDRLRSFHATPGTHGGALLVTGEPGVGKTEIFRSEAGPNSTLDLLRPSAGPRLAPERSAHGEGG
jgi:hypothetical protein